MDSSARPRIFVQIPSYRDRECQWTVKDLFEKARHPDRIFVGICWQTVPEDDGDCFTIETRPEQVRVAAFHALEAQGLGWARQQAQSLWRGEEYTLQIDSHMRFVPDWDVKLLTMLDACDSPSPVLTVHPPPYTPPDKRQDWDRIRVQCPSGFHENGVLEFGAKPVPLDFEVRGPLPTACCAGGFLFGPADVIDRVPADPGVYFNGEEPSLAARLWTHGYDLYSPDEIVLYHYYKREQSPHHWQDHDAWHARHQETQRRLRALLAPDTVSPLDSIVDLGPYGLGNERSLADYEAFVGVSFAGRTIAAYSRAFPFVLDDRRRERLLDRNIILSTGAHLFILDDAGVVYSETRHELYTLNTAGTFVWCALEDKLPVSERIGGLARLCGLSSDEAERAFVSLVGHWEGQGLLQNEAPAPVTSSGDGVEQAETPSPPTPASPILSWHGSYDYRLLDANIRVRFSDPHAEAWVRPVVDHLATTTGRAPDSEIAVVRDGGHYDVLLDGRSQATVAEPSMVAPLVKFLIMRAAIAHHDHSLHVHAGAVGDGERCILFPAAKGSGKSTLVAALLRKGYQYLSDEVALLERETCRVRPVPVSLCVKQSGLEVIASLYPGASDLPVHEREDHQAVRYLPPRREAIAADVPLPVSHLVFPAYRANGKGGLRPLERVQALRRLVDESVSVPRPLGLADAISLVRWLRGVSCHELVFTSLDEAFGLLAPLIPPPPYSRTFDREA